MSNQLSRRRFLQVTGGVMGVGLLAACAPVPASAPAAEGDAAAAGGDVAIDDVLWILTKQDFHESYNDYIRTEITAYADEQGWPLEIADIAGFTGGSGVIEKLAASVQAGDPPDLVMHDQLAATQMENLGLVEPADDQVAAVEAVFGKAAPYINQIGRVNDHWQYLPYHQRSDGGWYQAPAFEEAGIDLQAVRTYEDLFEATLAVSKPEEELYGWGTTVNRSGDGNFFINRVKTGYGAGWQDETGQYIATNSPEMIEAMNLIKAVYTDEKFAPMLPPGVLAWGDISNNEAYLGGILAYTTNGGTVYAKAIVNENPIAEITNYHKPPGGPVNQEFMSMGSTNWYFMKGGKNPEAASQMAVDFTSELARVDSMLASSPAYALPAYTDLWDVSETAQANPVTMQMKSGALDESGINAVTWPGPESAALNAITDSGTVNDMVNSIITGTPVEEAVAIAHDRMVLIFKEFGLPGEPA